MDKPEDSGFGFKQGFNLVSLLASAHAMAIVPFTRRNFGTQFFGLPALLTLGLLFFLSGQDPIMMSYLLVWLMLVAVHRIRGFIQWRRGEWCHSHYWGDSWFEGFFKGAKSQRNAKVVEVLFCLVTGAGLLEVSPVLGKFVLAGALSLPFTIMLVELVQAGRVRRLRDSVIEQQYLSSRYRGTRRDD